MSEHLRFETPDGSAIEVDNDHATLFRYRKAGKAGLNLSIYDHIFITDDEEKGAYLFLIDTPEDVKERLTHTMIEQDYECYLNQDDVAECDINAFERIVMRPRLNDLGDSIPSEWLEDGESA